MWLQVYYFLKILYGIHLLMHEMNLLSVVYLLDILFRG
jgi:hypothetical protein